jgi:hypothetical protein
VTERVCLQPCPDLDENVAGRDEVTRGVAKHHQAIVFRGRRYQADQVNRLNRAGLLEEHRGAAVASNSLAA